MLSATEFIESFRYKGSQPGLGRIQELLSRLGNPQERLHFIHVAGTNGKGSVCAMLSSILTKAGYTTGLFTSPCIHRIEEYFQINGVQIGDMQLQQIVNEIEPHVEAMEDKPTEFELITAMVIYYFAKCKCELVVLETGLGGRQDATNVIPAPLASVITRIGMDHMNFLGNTLEAIAAEKAGIIKPESAVVLCRQEDMVEQMIRQKCAKTGTDLRIADLSQIEVVRSTLDSRMFHYGGRKNVELGLYGNYQYENAAVVLEVIDLLIAQGYSVSDDAVRIGIMEAKWPGRFEFIRKDRPVILDGAHNPDGTVQMIESLCQYFPRQKFMFVMGVMKDKDYQHMIQTVVPFADSFITVTADTERALAANVLKEEIAARFSGPVSNAKSIAAAMEQVYHEKDAIICIFGTLYMMKEVREIWDAKEVQ